MSKETKYVTLTDPIDYDELSETYRRADWKWYDGYPSATRLQDVVARGVSLMAHNKDDFRSCHCTGGINIQWKDEKLVVQIHKKLAEALACLAK